ncbi:MAG: ribosome-binding factor A, partial [Gammaproteobacteria bacterium]
LRKLLGKQVRLKYLPRLEFTYDATLDTANHLEALLRDAARTPSRAVEEGVEADTGSSDRTYDDTGRHD